MKHLKAPKKNAKVDCTLNDTYTMKIKKIYFLLILFATQFAFAQDGIPVYQDYFSDNLYLLHPSMAGAAGSNHIRFTNRKQWFDQDEAPNLGTISYNTSLGDQSGI